jgi:hypothetical protein
MADRPIFHPKVGEIGKSQACHDCKRRRVKVRQGYSTYSTDTDLRRSVITENQRV